MTKSLHAMEKLKELPEERQDELAEALMAVAGREAVLAFERSNDDPHSVSDP